MMPKKALVLLGEFLRIAGYHVIPVTSGTSALKVLEHSTPDLILLDIMMPEMDGFEVCRHLKRNKKTKDLPVVFITAMTDIENKVEGFEAGGIDYITKPFQQKEVLAENFRPYF